MGVGGVAMRRLSAGRSSNDRPVTAASARPAEVYTCAGVSAGRVWRAVGETGAEAGETKDAGDAGVTGVAGVAGKGGNGGDVGNAGDAGDAGVTGVTEPSRAVFAALILFSQL